MDVSENHFEPMIESVLLGNGPAELPCGQVAKESGGEYGLITPGGYSKRSPDEYDSAVKQGVMPVRDRML